MARSPELARERASELVTDPDNRRLVLEMYDRLLSTLSDTERLARVAQSETINMAAAQIAGIRHTYWYARNAWIGALDDPKLDALFEPLTVLDAAPAAFGQMRQDRKILYNFSASGVIRDLDGLLGHMERLGLDDETEPSLFKVFDGARLAGVREAIAYARENGCYLIEAADVVVPISDQVMTDPDNFREATAFDPPPESARRWFDKPPKPYAAAYASLMAHPRPLAHDRVTIRRFLRPGPPGRVVPQYHLQKPEFRKYFQSVKHVAVIDAQGALRCVHLRRLKVTERAHSYAAFNRHAFEYVQDWYEKTAHEGLNRDDPIHDNMPDSTLDIGMLLTKAYEPELARLTYEKALQAAGWLLEHKHTAPGTYSALVNRATLLRTQWFAAALLGQRLPVSDLADAAALHFDFAQKILRADWHEYVARDHMEFALTALLAGKPDIAEAMLALERPVHDQGELVAAYRALAEHGADHAGTVQTCTELLEVIRHPAGGQFLSFGRLSGLQLALIVKSEFSDPEGGLGVLKAVEWMGR